LPDAGAPDIITFNGSLVEQFITFLIALSKRIKKQNTISKQKSKLN